VYNIHDSLKIRILGSKQGLGEILDSTLAYFRDQDVTDEADLTFVLGRYPSENWQERGYTVGDRIMYDDTSGYTTVFKRPIDRTVTRRDVEYVIQGDVRTSNQPVTVYVPSLPSQERRSKVFLQTFGRLQKTRALLTMIGDKEVLNYNIEEAAKLRLAILEPFLFYRLPSLHKSLVHGSVACFNGKGIMLAGSGHVRKTTLNIELVKNGFTYLGEDLVITGMQGDVFAYPEPIRLQPQHLELVPWVYDNLFENKSRTVRWLMRKIARHSPD